MELTPKVGNTEGMIVTNLNARRYELWQISMATKNKSLYIHRLK
jgi:hypothetical protein